MMLTWKYAAGFPGPVRVHTEPGGNGRSVAIVSDRRRDDFGDRRLRRGALAIGAGGWLKTRANIAERLASTCAGLLLLYPSARLDVVGFAILAVVIVGHVWRAKSAT